MIYQKWELPGLINLFRKTNNLPLNKIILICNQLTSDIESSSQSESRHLYLLYQIVCR